MSKELNQIQPLAQDEIEAWGDVPPLHARERTHYEGCWQAHLECAIAKINAQYDATRAEFVAPDTCHKLHARIAELERERDAARQELENAKEVGRMWYEDICEIKRALAEVGYPTLNIEDAAESVRRLGQERHTAIDNMHENADIADEFICLFKKANEAKREWRNESKYESQWAKHYHDDWIKVRDERDAAQGALEFAQRYWMDAIAERDAANKRAKEYVGVFKRVNAAKRVWRKRAEQAEAELVEAQSRLIAGDVYKQLDSVTYWKTRAEQAEADARALAQRVFETELLSESEIEIVARYLPREQMIAAGYCEEENEKTI